MGKSGSGKSALVEMFCNNNYTANKFTQVVSYTTRPKRSTTETGHIFINKDELDKYFHDIVAYTVYNNNYYFATTEQVNKADFYVIDPAGVKFFKEKYNGPKNTYIIYINVNAFTRFKRMLSRGDSFFKALKRIIIDAFLFRGFKHKADLVVCNNKDIITAYRKIKSAIYEDNNYRE